MSYSYSAIKLYEQCPLKYKLTRIDHLVEPSGDAANRGKTIHAEIEAILKGGLNLLSDDIKHLEEKLSNWIKVNGQSKTTQTTRLGLQIKFVDAETSEVLVGSGLGESSTIQTISILDGIDDDGVKFNQSTIGISTKKALETASSRVTARMIKKGIFKN